MIARGHRPLAPVVAFAALVVAFAALLFGAAGARGASVPQPPPKVILVRPPAAPAAVIEALVRLRGELVAAGFDADVVELALGPDVRGSLEKLAPASAGSATALVAVVASAEPGSAELWVIDRVTGKTVVRKVNAGATDPPRMAEVLSVRAVELLRASFLELAIATPPSSSEAPPAAPVVERFATATLEEEDWTWAVEAGGGTADAVGGPWNAILSVARIERALGNRFCARVSFAGLGTTARVDTPEGYVGLSQTVLLAEVIARFRRGRRIEPLLSLGAGTLRLAADSHEAAPYEAVSGARWAAAADVGVGVRFPLRRHRFELGVEAHALVAQPYPTVRFFETDVAHAGRPSLIGSVTLLGGI
ncbi:MAG TPA: hypothetical protein VH853_09105 [Polyangia bacterium]|nr:hypothetical protein [Polyangia bacterium]